MADVFVSYKAEDRRRVKPLVEALQQDGLSVWWDAHIGGGDEWRETIQRQLEDARCVLVVWSKRSVGPGGDFVRDEASRAQRRGVCLPILIDRVEPPLGFGERQALSLCGWNGSHHDPRYSSLLSAARAIIDGKPVPASVYADRRVRVTRRTAIAAGAVTLSAAAAGGAWLLLRLGDAEESASIAVLPFENLSGDPRQAYFSDGISEEIRAALTRLSGLKVAGRTSSEAVRNDDAKTAARKLGVANILTGTVRQSPSTIRVTAELIDGRTGLDRWGQGYDRAPGDAIKIQTDIAANVARALSAALGGAASAILVSGTRSAEAHNLFLKGAALEQSSDDDDVLRQAVQLMDAAIAHDPAYAEAFAHKAMILRILFGEYSRSQPDARLRGMSDAAANAEKAIQLAPKLATGHVALATVRSAQLDLKDALAHFSEAESLSPNDPQLLINYSEFLLTVRKFAEGMKMAQHAIRLDPLNPQARNREVLAYFLAGRYPEAVTSAERLLALSPNYSEALGLLGDTYFQMGKYGDASRVYASMPADHPYRLCSEAVVASRTGDRATADRLLKRLQALYGDAASWQVADIKAQSGDIGGALTAIERGYAARDPGMRAIMVDPWLASVRKEPRFQAVVRKLNFPG